MLGNDNAHRFSALEKQRKFFCLHHLSARLLVLHEEDQIYLQNEVFVPHLGSAYSNDVHVPHISVLWSKTSSGLCLEFGHMFLYPLSFTYSSIIPLGTFLS